MKGRLDAMVQRAGTHDSIAVPVNKFDQDINVFNCASGTLNLTTFELQPHNQADLRLQTGCAP